MLRAFAVLAISLLLAGCSIRTTLEKFATSIRDQASNAYGIQLATESVNRIPNGGSGTKARPREVEAEPGQAAAAAAGGPPVSPDQAATDQAIINAVSAAASYQADQASSASAAALAEPAPTPK